MASRVQRSQLELSTFSAAAPAGNFDQRFTKRRVPLMAEALDDDLLPKDAASALAHSKRTFQDSRASSAFTSRVLDVYHDTRVDDTYLPRGGLRCNTPRDELTVGNILVGRSAPKVDRGRRCNYDVPQTLSFQV